MRALIPWFYVFLLSFGFAANGAAQLRLSALISDGMVLQRETEVPVWGWADPASEVVVLFDGEEYPARADSLGAWSVVLPALEAGGPYTMTVSSGSNRLEIDDILVGDVWVASGQSNMEWVVANANDAEAEIAAATDDRIRHFKVPRSWAERPETTLAGGSWEAASPETAGAFTAVGYFFARELREHVGVPIGLINTSWGGSRIEPWMSAESLGFGETDIQRLMAGEREYEQRVLDVLRQRIGGDPPTEDPGLIDGHAPWAASEFDDASWSTVTVPSTWEEAGFEGMDGVAWYRTTFELSAEEVASGVRLIGLGIIDDSDIAWVNGVRVGETQGAWNEARVYNLLAGAVRPGRNVVAVRVEDTGGNGGITGDEDLLFVDVAGERRPLAGEWKFTVGAVRVNLEGRKNQVATLLYNKMIHPLLPFPIKGALWYQGESNASPGDAFEYRKLFADLITDWRARWNAGGVYAEGVASPNERAGGAATGATADARAGGDRGITGSGRREAFPFLFVQLANFMDPVDEPAPSNWAMLRESQSTALSLPNTGQAVAIDIGEADDIHPRNKQEVGRRLALAARRIAYNEDILHSGPVYTGHQIYDGKVVLAFEHVGRGLVARGGPLGGFAIAGEDGRFVRADAVIQGDGVTVQSNAVPDPVAVRYAWSDNPVNANLYNAEGLPASPFRTDDWEE